MGVKDLLVGVATLSLLLMVSAYQAYSGTATFYTKPSPSACYGKPPANGLYAAASQGMFKSGKACGQRYKITCVGKGCISNSVGLPSASPGASGKIVPTNSSGGPITVKIVDACSSCKPHQFALSLHAFSQLADPDLGTIRIRYQRV